MVSRKFIEMKILTFPGVIQPKYNNNQVAYSYLGFSLDDKKER